MFFLFLFLIELEEVLSKLWSRTTWKLPTTPFSFLSFCQKWRWLNKIMNYKLDRVILVILYLSLHYSLPPYFLVAEKGSWFFKARMGVTLSLVLMPLFFKLYFLYYTYAPGNLSLLFSCHWIRFILKIQRDSKKFSD